MWVLNWIRPSLSFQFFGSSHQTEVGQQYIINFNSLSKDWNYPRGILEISCWTLLFFSTIWSPFYHHRPISHASSLAVPSKVHPFWTYFFSSPPFPMNRTPWSDNYFAALSCHGATTSFWKKLVGIITCDNKYDFCYFVL